MACLWSPGRSSFPRSPRLLAPLAQKMVFKSGHSHSKWWHEDESASRRSALGFPGPVWPLTGATLARPPPIAPMCHQHTPVTVRSPAVAHPLPCPSGKPQALQLPSLWGGGGRGRGERLLVENLDQSKPGSVPGPPPAHRGCPLLPAWRH